VLAMNSKQKKLIEAWIISMIFLALLWHSETKIIRYSVLSGFMLAYWLFKERYDELGKMKSIKAYISESKSVRNCLIVYVLVIIILAYGSIFSGTYLKELSEGHRLLTVFIGPLLPLIFVQQVNYYKRLGKGA